ncbi:tetratricopeptide (TPR) repeat protein [Kineosphaera limosa]|nr:hypothetical protein [Kineosphaera limosa]NYE00206.1 tetratricopeptide (TPR) repeat protein [Kineosphaera limosa]
MGIHAFPLGLRLIVDETDRAALLAGSVREPSADGEAGADQGLDAVAAYNAFVLDPTADPSAIRAGLPRSVAVLVDVVLYTVGLADTPPPVDEAAAPEVRAVVLAALAGAATEAGDAAEAVRLLDAAAAAARDDSPVLAALLTANAIGAAHETGLTRPGDGDRLAAAAAVLTDTDLTTPLAQIHLLLGQLAHEHAAATGQPLRAAMHHYYSALQLVTEASEPLVWARAQVALATAQLATPMSSAGDQLRFGIATQALRAALRVLTLQDHPHQWAGATLNLANALIYAPSLHQGDNLVEAVELYDQVLAQRPVGSDPLARARVLANQGNALAHLGIFDHARANLVEARYLFESAGEGASAAAVRGLLDEIVRAQSAAKGTDPIADAAQQQRRERQMDRMPVTPGPMTSGMGVTMGADVPPRPKVVVVPASSRPTSASSTSASSTSSPSTSSPPSASNGAQPPQGET